MGHLRRDPEPAPRPREVGRIAAPSTNSRARALARALSVWFALFVVAGSVVACNATADPAPIERVLASPADPGTSGPAVSVPSGSAGESTSDALDLPGPNARIPRDAGPLAGRLEAELRALGRAIETWNRDGDTSVWPPPAEVELRSLYVQRATRMLASESALARRTLARMPRGLRSALARNVHASAVLFAFQSPVRSAEGFQTADPEPAGVLLRWFRAGERRFGVDWELLAAVMLIETRFGRIVSRSVAGASGPMQFIPSTWDAYGMGGDVHDPRDAIMGAANYLRASGAPADERGALHAYNPVSAYVDAVSTYADVMRRDPAEYYAYYTWQVFVRTVRGDVRITGPDR